MHYGISEWRIWRIPRWGRRPYTKEDFATRGETYDIILDTTGTASLARCDAALKQGGRLLAVQGSLAQALGMERPSKASRKKVIAGVTAMKVEDMELLARLAETGELKPVIDRSYPLESAAEAHAYVQTGRKRGSVVLSVKPDQGRTTSVEAPRRTAARSVKALATLGLLVSLVSACSTASLTAGGAHVAPTRDALPPACQTLGLITGKGRRLGLQ